MVRSLMCLSLIVCCSLLVAGCDSGNNDSSGDAGINTDAVSTSDSDAITATPDAKPVALEWKVMVSCEAGSVIDYNGSACVGLLDVWGTGPSDVFAVGTNGAFLHFDGQTWKAMENFTGGSGNSGFSGVWGTGPKNVFAVGYIPNNMGQLNHYEGEHWKQLYPNQNDSPLALSAIAGDSATGTAVAVGRWSTVWYYDGVDWGKGGLKDYDTWLNDAWIIHPSALTPLMDLLLVGSGGTIYRYKGGQKEKMATGTDESLLGIWASSPDNIYVVGTRGTLLHYDGQQWKKESSGTTEDLRGIWGTSPSNIYAVGSNSVIIHFDGTAWKVVSTGLLNGYTGLKAVWGSSEHDVFAVGGGIVRLSPK